MEIILELDETFDEAHYLPYIQFSFTRLRPDIISIKVTMRHYQDRLQQTLYDCNFAIATRQGQILTISDTQHDFDLAYKRALQRCVRYLQRRTPTVRQHVC